MVKARWGVPEARRAGAEEVECRGGEVEGEKLGPPPRRPRPLLIVSPSLNPNPVTHTSRHMTHDS